MMIKTPRFWQKKGVIVWLLWPLSLVYALVFYLNHRFKRAKSVRLPVVCVGNVIAGGAGKTPVALALGKLLKKRGVRFAYLSRAHRAKFEGVCEVSGDDARKFGDEPLLLAQMAPTFVAKNRLEGAVVIEGDDRFEAIILDDGMQNATLHKDLVVMVVDVGVKFGNSMLLPAGPLRQTVESGLMAADLVVAVGEVDEDLRDVFGRFGVLGKVVEARICALDLGDFEGGGLMAFCGLAYPGKFFSYLKKEGLDVVEERVFPDHYSYTDGDLEGLCREAESRGLKLVTTKKDWVKFSDKFKKRIKFLDIELRFLGEERVLEVLGSQNIRL